MMMRSMCSRQVPGGITAAPDNVEDYLAVFRLLGEAMVERGEAASKDHRVGQGDSMEYTFDPSKGL